LNYAFEGFGGTVELAEADSRVDLAVPGRQCVAVTGAECLDALAQFGVECGRRTSAASPAKMSSRAIKNVRSISSCGV
jgi:hypothetical protein